METLKSIIRELSHSSGPASVTILLQTHRAKPDNQQDPIALKNLIKEAQKRLQSEHPEVAEERVATLKKLAADINHNNNKDALILVANDELAKYYQLGIHTDDRVVIDNTFATRDIVRAAHERAAYYVLVLSRRNARLIHARNNRVESEFSDTFPMENDIVPDDRHEMTMSQGSDKITEHFFNKVDKEVQRIVNESPLPVILATEERNHDHYKKVMDRPVLAGHLNKNRDAESAEDIVREAWPVMQQYLQNQNEARLKELRQAVNQQRYLSDLSDIWRAVNEGRGATLFVERGYFQPAQLENNAVVPVDSPDGNNVVDDIVDEMIELNQKHGGEAIFVDKGDLEDFQGLALTTRF